MTFFDKRPEEGKEEIPEAQEEAVEEAIEKVKIGDDEYDPDDLKGLVELGKLGREVEEKYNTKLDRVYPEFTKKSQSLKEKEEELAALREEMSSLRPKSEEGELPPEERKKIYEKEGILTQDQFDSLYQQRRAGERLLDTCHDLEKEFDGKDGRPPFKTQDMLDYMKENSLGGVSPEVAYKLKFEKEIDQWKTDQLRKSKPDGLFTEKASTAGSKREPEFKVPKNEDELHSALSDVLGG